MCNNNNDIAWCNATLWKELVKKGGVKEDLTLGWKPLKEWSRCNLPGQPDVKGPHGQWINKGSRMQGKINCKWPY